MADTPESTSAGAVPEQQQSPYSREQHKAYRDTRSRDQRILEHRRNSTRSFSDDQFRSFVLGSKELTSAEMKQLESLKPSVRDALTVTLLCKTLDITPTDLNSAIDVCKKADTKDVDFESVIGEAVKESVKATVQTRQLGIAMKLIGAGA